MDEPRQDDEAVLPEDGVVTLHLAPMLTPFACISEGFQLPKPADRRTQPIDEAQARGDAKHPD